jgi:hypothetical protein
MTFAAFEIETVGPSVVVTAEEPSEAPTFGSLAFDSLPGAADPLDGAAGATLGGDTSSAALGATSAAEGGTEPTDADDEALVAAETDGLEGALGAGLWAVAVEVTDGGSADGASTTRGAGDSTFVTGGFTAVVGDAGATAVTTGEVVVCVTGGAGDSTACCVCGGASTIGATGAGCGALGGGASCDGASTTSGACSTFGSGAGAVVVTT